MGRRSDNPEEFRPVRRPRQRRTSPTHTTAFGATASTTPARSLSNSVSGSITSASGGPAPEPTPVVSDVLGQHSVGTEVRGDGGSRTLTRGGLSALPLPIGLRPPVGTTVRRHRPAAVHRPPVAPYHRSTGPVPR